MAFVPLVLTLLFWALYSRFSNAFSVIPAVENTGVLSNAQRIFYLYESELKDIDWNSVNLSSEADYLLSDDLAKISELEDAGYHLRVTSGETLLFSNFDSADGNTASSYSLEAAEGYFVESGRYTIIRDSFEGAGGLIEVTAVHDSARADSGTQNSLVPVYLIPVSVFIVFIAIILLAVILTGFILTRWLGHSILRPLSMLMDGTRKIAGGNLEDTVPETGKDEFAELGHDFEQMRLALKKAADERAQYETKRQEMLMGISHDLRSPLTSIKGYANGLKDGLADTDEKKSRYYDAILTRAGDLERLTDSLSILVRLENDHDFLNMEKVCMDEFIRQYLSEKQAWLKIRAVTINYRTDAPYAEARLDVREMQRVLDNLIENAIRYRIADTSIIDLTCTARGNSISLDFVDDGPGVSGQNLERIFDAFYREDVSRTKPELGSGLGLAIVKRIIEAHDGSAEAYLDNGLGIHICLPLVQRGDKLEKDTDRRG